MDMYTMRVFEYTAVETTRRRVEFCPGTIHSSADDYD